MPRSTPAPSPTAGASPATPLARPAGTPNCQPEGQGITREMRQDSAAFMAMWLLGVSTQEADRLVAGMQAKRRELAMVHSQKVALIPI